MRNQEKRVYSLDFKKKHKQVKIYEWMKHIIDKEGLNLEIYTREGENVITNKTVYSLLVESKNNESPINEVKNNSSHT
ncbi:hypothetical protein L8C07_06040 [Paenibacillus sp. CMAA1739]|uniref:hypothetical protein n=1 Tax=Paenibacillus ottowii TaxID=2315729 RepID=UPI002DBD4C3D|nr:hypothetical protein [Paenibacillus sp. CMAA1739]MEC4565500.1 hypothetical protein [Paenibacillus sp. CMAA1739]